MHPAVDVFLGVLSHGAGKGEGGSFEDSGVVDRLAGVYEKARSAMEYRADHLARRAAIERIIKRHLVFNQETDITIHELVRELRWAKYVPREEEAPIPKEKLRRIVDKYVGVLGQGLQDDWAVGVMSAEIEELLNPNVDYRHFTYFSFQVIKQKIDIRDEKNTDLLTFVTVDKIYAQSDDQQIGYHIVKLLEPDWDNKQGEEALALLREARELSETCKGHPLVAKLARYTRSQAAPLILLRDIYFSNPEKFREILTDEAAFTKKAKEVLTAQLLQMSGRVNRATVRSVVYIFLTKMLFGMLVEIPGDLLLTGEIATTPLLVNLLFPPGLMWLVSSGSWLPGINQQKDLVRETWRTISRFESLGDDRQNISLQSKRSFGLLYGLFSGLYLVIFAAVFGGIFYVLRLLEFSPASQFIFVFFLTIVAFFAYRIRQTALVYNWSRYPEEQSLGDMIALPILAVGSRLSQGLSRLNFLTFIFDFILEAPFKTILQILESWVKFLSSKRDDVIVG